MEEKNDFPKYQVSLFCGKIDNRNAQLVLRANDEEELLKILGSPTLAVLCTEIQKTDGIVNPVKEKVVQQTSGVATTQPEKASYPKCAHERPKGFFTTEDEAISTVKSKYSGVALESKTRKDGSPYKQLVCPLCKARCFVNRSQKNGKYFISDWS